MLFKQLWILFGSVMIYRVRCFSGSNHGWWQGRLMQRRVDHSHSPNFFTMRSKKHGEEFDNDMVGHSIRTIAPKYNPRSANQRTYVNYLTDSSVPIVFGIGPAGCGKTLFACTTAIDMLRRGSIQKIILTRPIVPVEEEELGFLPGSMVQKMDPWTRPIFDIFLEYYQQRDLDSMLKNGVIEVSPLAYMRGRTFKRSFIIADEMQNSTPNQMLMLTTRIGEGSKMVITGDLNQSDRCENNGLLDIMQKLELVACLDGDGGRGGGIGIKMVTMNSTDIKRSPIVAKIIDIYSGRRAFEDDASAKDVAPSGFEFSLTTKLDMISSPKSDTVSSHNTSTIANTSSQQNKNTVVDLNQDAALIPISHLLRKNGSSSREL